MPDLKILTDVLEKMEIRLSDQQIHQFVMYYEMLIEKNKVMNLTAITEWEDVVIRHFADSLSLVKCTDLTKVNCVIDLGTGAGFPGIPLKIAFPHLQITLVDSLGKRVRFLEEVIQHLGFDQISALHARAEDLGRNPKHREVYDLCVSRAVANLSTLCEYCLPFVRVNGEFISYKSGKAYQELEQSKKAVRLLGGRTVSNEDLCEFILPGTDMERILIRILKEKKTPAYYPRKAGMPGKEPL